MDSARWPRVERVLDLALESDPDDWSRVLDDECSGDAELRAEVEALLLHRHSAGRFLESPPAAAAAALVRSSHTVFTTAGPTRLGPYRLVRQIGQGGTSRVFLAERDDDQFTQRAAVKLLGPGRDSEIDQGRFRAERQILASLSHPHIARLLDGGVTDGGLPYLVMELVEGEPIDRHCATRALGLRQRLEMFITVAEATHYAHRNLIVHRDLKPSNILVTAEGDVKLLDFGLAKLLEPDRAPHLQTTTTQRWMTPEYAAPEQVLGLPASTSTDIYQLGVVLYELLTGALPFGTRERNPYELERSILEEDPAPPSARAADASLRGDLDAIVLKALHKERDQRYVSAQALADDVRRHLTGHPVLARRQTTTYRAWRYARRHAWMLAGAASVLVLLAAYAATVTVQRRRVERALARAQAEAQKAEASTQFLIDLFDANVSGIGPYDIVTPAQLLAAGERQASERRDEPLVHARMLVVLGRIHRTMRSSARAESLLTGALELRQAHLREDDLEVAESLYLLGMLAHSRADHPRARELLQRALEIQRRELGERHPTTAETAYRLSSVVNSVDGLIASNRQLLAARIAAHGPEHPTVADEMWRLGRTLRRKGELDEAERLIRQALAMRQRVAPADERMIASLMGHLGIVLKHQGRLTEAEHWHREELAMFERVEGPSHPSLAGPLRTLSEVLVLQGRFDEAEELARRDVAIQERTYAEGHENRTGALENLAFVLRAKGALHEAEALRRRALAYRRATYGTDHIHATGAMHALAEVLLDLRRYDEAEELLRRVVSIRERAEGPDATMVAVALPDLARLLRERGDLAGAHALLVRALDILHAAGHTDQQENVQWTRRELALLYDAWGRPDSAAAQRRLLLPRR